MAKSLTIAELKVLVGADTRPLTETLRALPRTMRAEMSGAIGEITRGTNEAVKTAAQGQKTRVDGAREASRQMVTAARQEGAEIVNAARAAGRNVAKEQREEAREAVRSAQLRSREIVAAAAEQGRQLVDQVRKAEAAEKKAMASIRAEFDQNKRTRLEALREIERVELQSIRNRMKGWEEEARAAKRAGDAAIAARRDFNAQASQRVRSAATGAQVVGGAALLGLGAAEKEAVSFDGAMRRVNSIAQLTDGEFKELRRSVMAFVDDPSIKQMPEDLADGLYNVYSSGFKGGQGLDILKQSAYGATAGITDTATASRVLMAVLNSGIRGVGSAREAMDVLFQEVNYGVNTFEELANQVGDVLPTAKAAGISFQEVSASMALLTLNGVSAAESATALNNLLRQIISPSAEVKKKTKDLGIEWGVAALQSKGLGGWLDELSKKTHGSRQAMIEAVPEIRAMKAELILAGDNGKRYAELLDKMNHASDGVGATQKALSQIVKGSQFEWEKFQQELRATAIEAGQTLIPMLRAVFAPVRDLTHGFRDLDQETQAQIVHWGMWGSAALLATGTMVKVTQGVMEMAAAWNVLTVAQQAAIAGNLRWAASAGGIGAAAIVAATYLDQLTRSTQRQLDEETRSLEITSRIHYSLTDFVESRHKAGDNRSFPELRNEWLASPQARKFMETTFMNADGWAEKQEAVKARRGQVAGNYWERQAGSDLGAEILKHATDGIRTPKGQASCAFFASEVIRAAGGNIPKIGSAYQFKQYLEQHGAVPKQAGHAAPGDVIVWRGKGYGEQKYNEGGEMVGYHAGIMMRGGNVRSSTGGKTTTRPMYDLANATAYTIPNDMSVAAAKAAASLTGDTGKGNKRTPYDQWKAAMNEAQAAGKVLQGELGQLSKGFVEHDEIVERVRKGYRGVSDELQDRLIKRLKDNKAALDEVNAAAKLHAFVQETYAKIRANRMQGSESELYVNKEFGGADAKRKAIAVAAMEAHKVSEQQKKDREDATKAEEAATRGLKDRLKELNTQWQITIASDEKHRRSLELMGKAYEKLNDEQRKYIDGIVKGEAKQRDYANAMKAIGQIGDAISKGFGKIDLFPDEARGQEMLKEIQARIRELRSGGNGAISEEEKLVGQGKLPAGLKNDIQKALDAEKELRKERDGASKEAASNAKAIDRLREAEAQARIEFENAKGPVDRYTQVLKELGMASRDLTPEQKAIAQQIAQWDAQRHKIEQIRDLVGVAEDAVQDGFRNIMESGKVTWAGLLQGFDQMLLQMVIRWGQSQISKGFESWIGILTKGITGGGGGADGPGGANGPGYTPPGVQYAAIGGPVFPNRPVIVGERGPELYVPNAGGTIVPNHKMGGGGMTVHQHFHFPAGAENGFRYSDGQRVSDAASRGLRDARRS